MRDTERHKLLFGPYGPPRTRAGRRLFDEIRGTVTVAGYTDGEIPWPCTRIGRFAALILCSDLVRAVRRESSAAVQHWWGVSKFSVTRWRRSLGVGRINEGSKELWRRWCPAILNTPVVRKKVLAAIRRPRRPDPSSARLRQSARSAHWTPERDSRLGTMPDHLLAEQLGVSFPAVNLRRRKLGIPAFRPEFAGDRRPSFFQLSREKLSARRLSLGLTQRDTAHRADISPDHYPSLERGIRQTRASTLLRLAAALRCRPKDLVVTSAKRRASRLLKPRPDETHALAGGARCRSRR